MSSSSSSSPFSLLLHLSGNNFWMYSHLCLSIRPSFLDRFLAQFEMRILHIGQHKLVDWTWAWKHGMHSSCLHGITTGSINNCRQIGHIKSATDGFSASWSPWLVALVSFCDGILPALLLPSAILEGTNSLKPKSQRRFFLLIGPSLN